MSRWNVAMAWLAGMWASGVGAQTALPEGGQALINPDLGAFEQRGFTGEVVEVAGPGFTEALRITTNAAPTSPWDLEVGQTINRAVQVGDVALVRVFARTLSAAGETGEGTLVVYSQLNRDPWAKSVYEVFTFGTAWQEILVPYTFIASYEEGTHDIVVGLGFGPQTVEIGGIEVVYYGKSLALDSLPRTPITYPGREVDAPWRAAAAARIAQYRQGDITLEVVDARGQPVAGAEVSINLRRHAFPFSTAVYATRIVGTGTTNGRYREELLKYFNAAGTENDLKWPAWAGEWGAAFKQARTLQALSWLQEKMVYVRGHVMVWPGQSNLPRLVTDKLGTPAQDDIPALVLDHIEEVSTATRGLIDGWDVVNEPYDNHLLMDLFGQEVMVAWFRRAREVLPEAELFLNDYGIETDGGRNVAHREHFLATLRYLIDADCGIDGAGIQGHFGSALTAPERVYEIFDEVAATGIPRIHITEFDVDTYDPVVQADYLRDYYTIAFSHPKVELIQMWGFWEGQHWRPRAAILNRDWSERPAAVALRKLLTETWHTQATGNTGSDGRWASRGFFGDYDVTVTVDGKVHHLSYTLRKDGPPWRLVVPSEATSDLGPLLLEGETVGWHRDLPWLPVLYQMGTQAGYSRALGFVWTAAWRLNRPVLFSPRWGWIGILGTVGNLTALWSFSRETYLVVAKGLESGAWEATETGWTRALP